MHRAVAVGANGKGCAYVFAVDDDCGFGRMAGHVEFGIGVIVDDGFDLADMAKLHGTGPLLLSVAPAVLDQDKAGVGCDLAVKVGFNLGVIARCVKALCGIWANSKSFLPFPCRRAPRVS